MSEQTEGTQVQEAAPEQTAEQKASGKGKHKGTGNLIHDVAVEIESLTKTKALNQAEKLAEDIETNYFRLGGLLALIRKQQWFEGFPTFEAYVLEKFGFASRKADYLISIYTNLVEKQIPWEAVSHLGWTKLKDLAPILTPENMGQWIDKASTLSVSELQAALKAGTGTGEGGTATTSSDVTRMAFKLHKEQAEQVQTALAKAKGELQTDHDNVAIAAICGGYLANVNPVAAAGPVDLVALFKEKGYEAVLGAFEQAFPEINLTAEIAEPAAAGA